MLEYIGGDWRRQPSSIRWSLALVCSRVRLFSALHSLRFEDKPSDISIMARQNADVHIEMMIDGDKFYQHEVCVVR